jgi:hypothetical protein
MSWPNLKDHHDILDSPWFIRLSIGLGPHSANLTHGRPPPRLLIPLFSSQFLYLGDRDLVLVEICAEEIVTSLCINFHSVYALPQYFSTQFPATSLGLILLPGAYIAFDIWHRLYSDSGQLFLRGPAECLSSFLHLKMETDPVSETLCFLAFRILDDGQNPEPQWFWVLYTITRIL